MFSFKKSPDSVYENTNVKIYKALKAGSIQQAKDAFFEGIQKLALEKRIDLIGLLIKYNQDRLLAYKVNTLYLTKGQVVEISLELDKEGQYKEALALLNISGHTDNAVIFAARHKDAEGVGDCLQKTDLLSREIMKEAFVSWEKYNGSFLSCIPLLSLLDRMASKSPELIPDIPEVREYLGDMREAGELYEQEMDFFKAGKCFEQAGDFYRANENYLRVDNRERISVTAEKIGNLEMALQYADDIGRKAALLLKLGRILDAWRFALQTNDDGQILKAVQRKAKDVYEEEIRRHEYLAAIALLPTIIEESYLPTYKKSLLEKARKYYRNAYTMATDDETAARALLQRVRVEELDGNFTEAGSIAEEHIVRGDFFSISSLADDNLMVLEQAGVFACSGKFPIYKQLIEERVRAFLETKKETILTCLREAEREVRAAYAPCLGIDFGMTNSVAAIFRKDEEKVEWIPVEGLESVFEEPSCFGFEGNGRIVFGEKVKNKSQTDAMNVVYGVKRHIGSREILHVGGRTFKPEEAAATILGRIRRNAEDYLAEKVRHAFSRQLWQYNIKCSEQKLADLQSMNGIPVTVSDAVITVPVAYTLTQRKAMKDAAEAAGLKVLRLISGSSAIAIGYGFKKASSETFAVIGFGGGALDLSLVDTGEGIYEVISADGDANLGGIDIDRLLTAHISDYIKRKYGIHLGKDDKTSLYRVQMACEELKIGLFSANTYTVLIPWLHGIPQVSVTVTRETFERIASPVIKRFKDKLLSAVKEWKARNPVCKTVLVSGKTCKIHIIDKIIREVLTGMVPVMVDSGKTSAAGAALMGAVLSGIKGDFGPILIDIVPYSLGVAVKNQNSQNGELKIKHIISRGSRIPATQTEVFSPVNAEQTQVDILVYQGEAKTPENNEYIGKVCLTGITPGIPDDRGIRVIFSINIDGILNVSAEEITTGRNVTVQMEGTSFLTGREKRDLQSEFDKSEQLKDAEKTNWILIEEIRAAITDCHVLLSSIDMVKKEFQMLFLERVETNAGAYLATPETGYLIQEMFRERDILEADVKYCQRQVAEAGEKLQTIIEEESGSHSWDALQVCEQTYQSLLALQSQMRQTLNDTKNQILLQYLSWNKALRSMKSVSKET